MDYAAVSESLQNSYRLAAKQYRRDDEIEVTTEHHRHLRGILERLSRGFGRPISALDAGCGTGRYFHCLKNVERLVGIDISKEMLEFAEHPVRAGEISIRQIELRNENIYLTDFPEQAFELIYCLGMFGYGCPVTMEQCQRFHRWLKPGGKLFFDTVDTTNLFWWEHLNRFLRQWVAPWSPARWQAALARREGPVPFCGVSRRELKNIMRTTSFEDFSISAEFCHSPLWRGVHLECVAAK